MPMLPSHTVPSRAGPGNAGELFRLDAGQYVKHAEAKSGEVFQTSEPFAIAFDPVELLEAH